MIIEHSGETYWKHWIEAGKVLWILLIFTLKKKIHSKKTQQQAVH